MYKDVSGKVILTLAGLTLHPNISIYEIENRKLIKKMDYENCYKRAVVKVLLKDDYAWISGLGNYLLRNPIL